MLEVVFQERALMSLRCCALTEEGPLTELFSQCHDKVRGWSTSKEDQAIQGLPLLPI